MVRGQQKPVAEEPSIVERLVLDAEIQAERTIGWVRLGLSVWLLLTMVVTFVAIDLFGLDMGMDTIRAYVRQIGMPTQFAFLLVGILAVVASSRRRWRSWMAYLFVAADALLIGFSIHAVLKQTGLDGSFIFATPPVFVVPILFSVGSLRPRPQVQVFSTVLYAVVLLAVAYAYGGVLGSPGLRTVSNLPFLFEVPSNALRLALLVATGLVIAMGAMRTRTLLMRSVRETQRRKSLTRFLPAEIAPLVANEDSGTIRLGRRQLATVMFIDIRDSTSRAEKLDPQRLSVFISSFRRRIMRAVEANDGIVDKFIGDGALVLFGVEHEGEDLDGAAQALACARQLLALIERWNVKRQFTPSLRVGIGVHTGEVYVGVVGDERRLEFTVLGDSVNVAARLETLTKTLTTPLLASEATVVAAGERDGWESVHDEPLRGRSGAVVVMAPQGAPHWAALPSAQPKAAVG